MHKYGPLPVQEWTPNARNAIGLDLGKYGKRRTSGPQLSCTIALIVKQVKYDPGNDPVRAPLGRDPSEISTHGMRIDSAVRYKEVRTQVDC